MLTASMGQSFVDGGDGERGVGASGTGSNPAGPNGRQRASRRTVNHRPRRVPWTISASWAYAEQEGVNRQGEGRPSIERWYHSISRTRRGVVGADWTTTVTRPAPAGASEPAAGAALPREHR